MCVGIRLFRILFKYWGHVCDKIYFMLALNLSLMRNDKQDISHFMELFSPVILPLSLKISKAYPDDDIPYIPSKLVNANGKYLNIPLA